MSQAEPRAAYSWTSLGRGGVEVEADARREAMELARALAAQTIVLEHDAVAEELPDRMRAIGEAMWPASPLGGYGLHASLGAYLVAKVAVGWAPSGMIGLRREPFNRDGLIDDLVEHGVDRGTALAMAGDWSAVEPGFIPDPQGLDTSRIAGLVECSLSRRERARALSQVAYSARCLDRLASTATMLTAIRHVLPVLPPDALGRATVVGMTAIALARPDRALELLGPQPHALAERTIAELAQAIVELDRGRLPELDDTGAILTAPLAGDDEGARREAEEPSTGDTDDVLEIVEERIDPGPGGNGHSAGEARSSAVRPPRWTPDAALDEERLGDWHRRFQASLGIVSARRGLLGLRLPPPAPTNRVPPLPPDERVVAVQLARADADDGKDVTERIPVGLLMSLEALRLTDTAFDPLFPTVRGALRTIVHAAEGHAPSAAALAGAGDLAWVFQRAKALAAIVNGDLETAVAAVAGLEPGAAPEGRWAADRLRRFGGRRLVRATPEEARPAAAGIALDLAHQLGRTIAGCTERIG